MKAFSLAWIIFASLFILNNLAFAQEFFILDGKHRFCIGDNLLWADPDFDDSSWEFIKVPGSWRSQHIRLRGIGWYRIHFNMPESFKPKRIGIYLGIISDADEVYLNGVKLGGEGIIAEDFVLAPYVPRVYEIPYEIIKYNKENVIAIRVMNLYFDGGIIGSNVIIGDYRDLILKAIQKQRVMEILEAVILTVLGIFVLGLVFLYTKGAREKEILYFFLVLVIYGLYFFIDSFTFYKTGLKFPIIQKLSISLACIWLVCFFFFLLYYFDFPVLRIYKVFSFLFILMSLSILFGLSLSSYSTFLAIWMGFIIPISLIGTVYLLIKAYRMKKVEMTFILAGIIALIIGGVVGEIFLDFNIGCYDSLLQPWDYGMFFFLLTIMYGIVVRFIHMKNKVRLFASKILIAQEEERKRLARELHDGLSQDLMVIKFNLQHLNHTIKNLDLNSIIQDIDKSIKELRDISMGLRPALLTEMGLQTAIKTFSKDFSKKSGIDIELNLAFYERLPVLIEENLFRIFQEALNNIRKHSHAKKVKILLNKESDKLTLKIEDDGAGFSFENKKTEGLGLETMAERANLIEANFEVITNKGKGTKIIVEVPLNDKDTLGR